MKNPLTSFPVWFNPAQKQVYDDLKKSGLTSRSFIDFVKDSFHDKVDGLVNNTVDLSTATIEQLAREQIKKMSKIKDPVTP